MTWRDLSKIVPPEQLAKIKKDSGITNTRQRAGNPAETELKATVARLAERYGLQQTAAGTLAQCGRGGKAARHL
jgi:hypothetical protein